VKTARDIPPFAKKVLINLQVGDNPAAVEIAGELWREAWNLVEPATWTSCTKREVFFSLFHPYARQSSAIQRLLSDAVGVCLLVATIGAALERRTRDYFACKESYRGYVLDKLGSYLVEQEIRVLDNEVEIESQVDGKRCTRRYSPGYGDFSLESQALFVNMARNAIPGLKIVPGGFILPEKTVTAIKGISVIGKFEGS